jgi:hypothetical protein
MAVIQPGLLFDTEKQAKVLLQGIKAICYELSAPKDEVNVLSSWGRGVNKRLDAEKGNPFDPNDALHVGVLLV